MPDSLTKKQKQLMQELEELSKAVRIDFWNIKERERENRTTVLEVLKRELVRGEIVGQYTLVDELLSTEICRYFFPGNSIKLWRTKRFERFNFFVIERLYMLQKLALVKDIYAVPKDIVSKIESLNALRNAMAHAFFPENLRAYKMKGRPAPRKPIAITYKGIDIFTTPGVERFVDDCGEIFDFFVWKIKRRKRKKVNVSLYESFQQ